MLLLGFGFGSSQATLADAEMLSLQVLVLVVVVVVVERRCHKKKDNAPPLAHTRCRVAALPLPGGYKRTHPDHPWYPR